MEQNGSGQGRHRASCSSEQQAEQSNSASQVQRVGDARSIKGDPPAKRNGKVLWKLIALNSVVIGIVVWLAAFSVKEFACYLVAQYPLLDTEKSAAFSRTMQSYLVDVSLFAISIAAVFHYLFVRKLLKPLQQLTAAAQQMTTGAYPAPLPRVSRDEIGQLTDTFNRMIAQLKRVDRERSELLQNVAHELRTPLTNVSGYLEALSSGVLEGNRQLYESLYDEATRLTQLVDQLQQLNVWEGQAAVRTFGEVSIEDVVTQSEQSFALEFAANEIACDIRVEEAQVWGDAAGLKQVVDNLLRNALTFDEGGWLRVTGEQRGSEYCVTVTNRGQAIPPEQAETIFTRFSRVEESRSRDTGGAGLGLAIVKEIVTQHGGRVGLRTGAGQRHAFWFTVPLAEQVK